MSIKGIDTQIMVNRTLELSKDASSMQRRDQVAQSNFAAHMQEMVEHKKSQVQDLQEAGNSKITDEESGKKNFAEDESEGKEKKRQKQNVDLELDASLKPGEDDSGMRIDIRV